MSSIQPKFCPHCGMKLDAEDAFCRRCGNKIEKELKVITPPLVPEKARIPAPSVRKRTVRRKKTRDPVVTGFYIVLALLCCAIVITLTVTNIQERRVATARTVGDRISVVMTPPPTPSSVQSSMAGSDVHNRKNVHPVRRKRGNGSLAPVWERQPMCCLRSLVRITNINNSAL